jgi:hypothetical protein
MVRWLTPSCVAICAIVYRGREPCCSLRQMRGASRRVAGPPANRPAAGHAGFWLR